MKIMVTGSTGMVGRNLSNAIRENTSYKLLAPSRAELDLSREKDVFEYVKNNSPDLIVHCAGKVGGIQANIADPVAFLVQNLDVGRNVVLAAKEARVKKVINLGSSCMYPRGYETPMTEDKILTGELEPTNEGYALAKITIAKLCDYISKTDNELSYKTLIPSNLYGKYDNFSESGSHLIPAIIRKTIKAINENHSDIEIWGNGEARREFMYVEDLVNFILYSIENFEKIPLMVNVGIENDYTIKDYYRAVGNFLGFEGKYVHDLSKPVGMNRKKVNTELLFSTGWRPTFSLKEGISKTVEYYKNEVEK